MSALAAAVCSRQRDAAGQAGAGGALTDANLAFADMGGAVEDLTGNYGPGFTGRRLIDGLLKPTWKLEAPTADEKISYPQEAVISFYERQPALIAAVTIVLPDPATLAPKDVEVWTSMDADDDRYAKASSTALAARPGEQTISFAPVEARFVKLRIVSGASDAGLEIAEVKVMEAARSGYTALFQRQPRVKSWKGSPREAAQRGLDWLQHAAPTWAAEHKCFGCHVQAQALMGQAVALESGYRVNFKSIKALNEDIRSHHLEGRMWDDSLAGAVFGAMGMTYAADLLKITDDKGMFGDQEKGKGLLLRSVDRLVAGQRKDGSVPMDHYDPPIVQGEFMTTANTLVALHRAAATTGNSSYAQAAARGLAWIATHEPDTTQDEVFKIIALTHYASPDQKKSAWPIVERLRAEQKSDGGWGETQNSQGSNAIATGQVLYAFKQAGVSIRSPIFTRGVEFLIQHQVNDLNIDNGSWPAMHSDSRGPSSFAHTMWAVIGLAGAFDVEPDGAVQVVMKYGDKPPTRNLEIVLDVSGSMNTKLGATTRWAVALDVFKKVVAQLPPDHNVGLRVYGHRHPAKSDETCTDTELMAPIETLDRDKLLKAVSTLRPRGETPLIRSILETLADLKEAGGGSVIVITDGEESCHGDAAEAAAAIKASGLNLTLNVVGFTLTGQAAQAELGGLAGSTGGRYHAAQDGAQLSRTIMATALRRLPFVVLDNNGRPVASGETGELGLELPPGMYRVRIDAFGQLIDEPVTITRGQTTALELNVTGDKVTVRR